MATENAVIAANRAQGLHQAMEYAGVVNVGAALTLTKAEHNGFQVMFNAAVGAATLPAATGSGMKFTFVAGVVSTTPFHTILSVGTDVFRGNVGVSATATGVVSGFGALAASETITLGTNTGNQFVGDSVTVTDVASGFWHVQGRVTGAAPATPFS